MTNIKMRAGMTAALLAASAALLASPSAVAAPAHTQTSATMPSAVTYKCQSPRRTSVKTNRATPVHTAPYGSATITKTISAGITVRIYADCYNSSGNLWYEITGTLDNGTTNARFIFSAYGS